MQKKFLLNLLLLLSLNLLVKPFYIFFIDLKVQNVVGAEEFGFYFSVFNFSMLFNIFLDMGITNFNNRNISRHKQLLNKHFSGIVGLRLLLAIVFGVVVFAIALIAGYDSRQLYILMFLAFNQFLIWFIFYLRSNITGLHLFVTDSFLSILDRVIMIIICGYLIVNYSSGNQFKIEWFVYCQTAAYLLTAVLAFIFVARKSRFLKLSWNFVFFRMILKQSFPFAMLTLLMVLYNRIDSVLLERILPEGIGATEAGIYAAAFRLLEAVIIISYLFSVLLLPIFSRMIKIKENVEKLTRLSFSMIILLSSTAVLISLLYKSEIITALYQHHTAEVTKIFPVIMFSFIPISIIYIFGTLLTANGNMRMLNITAVVSVVVNIVVNLILIPRFFALGSGIASLSAQSISALVQIILAVRVFKFRVNYIFLFRLLIFLLVITLGGVLFNRIIENWIIGMLLTGLFSVVAAFIIRFISLKNIIILLRSSDENE